jgi:hypothetical protein
MPTTPPDPRRTLRRRNTCPYAHPGEKARRRSPAGQAYQAACCPDVRRRGRCPRGGACPWAHSVFEIHLHPAKFRTKVVGLGWAGPAGGWGGVGGWGAADLQWGI